MNQLIIFKLIMFFMIYSFFGWTLESILKTCIQRKPVNSGFLYGPFCPIYGIGALIMLIFLKSFKDNIILLFIIGFIILSIWEYLVGVLLEKTFHTKYWDYSQNKFNFQGRICLMNSIFWGALGVVFIQYIHPFISLQIDKVPETMLIIISTFLAIYMIIDLNITIVKTTNIQTKIENLKEITEKLKEQLEEIKKIDKNKTVNKEAIQTMIDELKYRQTKIKRKLYKQVNRLRKAFPTMKSEAMEKISETLNQKIEIRKNRK